MMTGVSSGCKQDSCSGCGKRLHGQAANSRGKEWRCCRCRGCPHPHPHACGGRRNARPGTGPRPMDGTGRSLLHGCEPGAPGWTPTPASNATCWTTTSRSGERLPLPRSTRCLPQPGGCARSGSLSPKTEGPSVSWDVGAVGRRPTYSGRYGSGTGAPSKMTPRTSAHSPVPLGCSMTAMSPS